MSTYFAVPIGVKPSQDNICRLNPMTASQFPLSQYGVTWRAVLCGGYGDAVYLATQLIPAGIDGYRWADLAQVASEYKTWGLS